MLQDTFNRRILYLRLSLTQRCNLACKYCLPFGYHQSIPEELTLKEIYILVKAFTELGVTKVRLTGGEPTLRTDFIDIVKTLKQIKQISNLALTTNGIKLLQNALTYYSTGIDTINISLDSLNSKNFQWITHYPNLDKILQALKLCLTLPFKKIKVNAVLLKTIIQNDFPKYLELVKNYDIDVRFIELMHTRDNESFYIKHHMIATPLQEHLLNNGWQQLTKVDLASGPSKLFTHNDYKGKIGFITPYSNKFCTSCNRVRVNSVGELQLCLFGTQKFNLRPYLQDQQNIPELKEKLIELLKLKPEHHSLEENNLGLGNNFYKIGG